MDTLMPIRSELLHSSVIFTPMRIPSLTTIRLVGVPRKVAEDFLEKIKAHFNSDFKYLTIGDLRYNFSPLYQDLDFKFIENDSLEISTRGWLMAPLKFNTKDKLIKFFNSTSNEIESDYQGFMTPYQRLIKIEYKPENSQAKNYVGSVRRIEDTHFVLETPEGYRNFAYSKVRAVKEVTEYSENWGNYIFQIDEVDEQYAVEGAITLRLEEKSFSYTENYDPNEVKETPKPVTVDTPDYSSKKAFSLKNLFRRN